MTALKVKDLMTEKVYSIRANEDLARLQDLMEDLHIRHVPVVDDEGNVLGLVSQRDLVRTVLYTSSDLPITGQRDLLKNMTASEIMTADPETVEADQDAQEAGQTMLDNKLGCLPVVDGNKLIGILTEADFVKYVVGLGPD